MSFLKWPAIVSALAFCIFAVFVAFKVVGTVIVENPGAVFAGLFLVFGGVVTVIVGIMTVVMFFDEEGRPFVALPSFWLMTGQWAVIGFFFMFAGTTFPLQESESPWVTRDGAVYTTNEEVPRGFIRPNGTHFNPSGVVAIEVPWSDRGVTSGTRLNFTTTVKLDTSWNENDEALEQEFRSIFAENPSLNDISQRLVSRATLAEVSSERIREMVPMLGVAIGQEFPVEAEWAKPFRVSSIEHSVVILAESNNETVAENTEASQIVAQ
jgi:hypothetical protein